MKTIEERRGERKKWSDERLTLELANAAAGERGSLVEFDHRSLSQKGAHHTLFDYCTRKLGYSSSEAGRRIAVARKGETFPPLVEMIERGDLHLSGAAMLAGLLTPENHAEVLRRAKGRTQDEIARLVAALAPRRAPKDSIRAIRAPAALVFAAPSLAAPVLAAPILAAPILAAPALGAPDALPAAPPAASLPPQPAAEEELYLVSFCATGETSLLIERAKEVLRHRFPKGGLDEIFNLALKTLLARFDRDLRKPRRAGRAPAKDKRSRYVPEAVKRESWERAAACAPTSLRTGRGVPREPGWSSTTRRPTRWEARPWTPPISGSTAGPTTRGRPDRRSVHGQEAR